MKRSLLAYLAVCTLFTLAETSAGNRDAEIVLVDMGHSQIGQPKGVENPKYHVHSGSTLFVDARKFDFKKSLFPNVQPNAVQLVIDENRQYYAKWTDSNFIELSPATLIPLNDSLPFTGLKAGDSGILVIGEQRVEKVRKQIVLKALWVGLFYVRERR